MTVGYGDIGTGNSMEKVVAIILMFIGVFFYSVTIGSLSSLLSSIDGKKAKFARKLSTLNEMQRKYFIENSLYNRIKLALEFGVAK